MGGWSAERSACAARAHGGLIRQAHGIEDDDDDDDDDDGDDDGDHDDDVPCAALCGAALALRGGLAQQSNF